MSGFAEGGCLCGKVRYRVSGDAVAATLCHCADCRKASGGTNVAWAVFERDRFDWLSDEPADYSSSPGIHWLYCQECGSTVGYHRSERPHHMDITTGTLDDPDRYPPGDEIWLSQKIGWEELHPAMRKFERSSLNESDGSGPSGEWSDPAAE